MTTNEKLQKGDYISIHWENGDRPGFAYDLRYKGRNKEKGYVFESTIYGWNYIVDCKKETVTFCGYGKKDWATHPVDNSTGWLRYLPD